MFKQSTKTVLTAFPTLLSQRGAAMPKLNIKSR